MSILLDSILNGNTAIERQNEKRVRAFAWARVSTDMQEEKGLSMPEQLREIRLYAEKHGIEIAAEFSEAASAFQKKSRRVEFERMLEMAKSDKFRWDGDGSECGVPKAWWKELRDFDYDPDNYPFETRILPETE